MKKSSTLSMRAGAEQQLATNYLWIAIFLLVSPSFSAQIEKNTQFLFRFFHCQFLRSFFWLCSLLRGWSILGFDIFIIKLILRVVRIMFFINMTTPSTVSHGHVLLHLLNTKAPLRIHKFS